MVTYQHTRTIREDSHFTQTDAPQSTLVARGMSQIVAYADSFHHIDFRWVFASEMLAKNMHVGTIDAGDKFVQSTSGFLLMLRKRQAP